MDKKSLARLEMLKKLSSEKRDKSHSKIGEELKAKKGKLQKVEVASDSKEGLEEGLSLAQKLMQAKFGDKLDKKKEESAEHEGCEYCENEGCALCEEEDSEESDSDELSSIE